MIQMVAFSKVFTARFQYLLVAWTIVVLFVLLQMKLVGYHRPDVYWPLKDYLIYFFSQIVIGTCLIYFFVIPIYDVIKKVTSLYVRTLSFVIHGFAFGVAHILVMSLLHEFKQNNSITAEFKDRFYNLFFTDLHNSIKTYLILIVILFAYDLFKTNANSIIKQKNLENEVDKVKLHSLKAQLQPHFLFNALNNIVALIDENKRKAQQSLIYLSDLLRYTVNMQPLNLVGIQEEIRTIKTYVSIEKAKYETQLDVSWDIQPNFEDFLVPPLIIQPLVENAIKHGFKDHTNQLCIVISIDRGKIVIKNNGSSLPLPLSKGNGLRLVEKRLQAHFGKAFSFKLKQQGHWIINTIKIDDFV